MIVQLEPNDVGAFCCTESVDDQHRFCLRRSAAALSAAAVSAARAAAKSADPDTALPFEVLSNGESSSSQRSNVKCQGTVAATAPAPTDKIHQHNKQTGSSSKQSDSCNGIRSNYASRSAQSELLRPPEPPLPSRSDTPSATRRDNKCADTAPAPVARRPPAAPHAPAPPIAAPSQRRPRSHTVSRRSKDEFTCVQEQAVRRPGPLPTTMPCPTNITGMGPAAIRAMARAETAAGGQFGPAWSCGEGIAAMHGLGQAGRQAAQPEPGMPGQLFRPRFETPTARAATAPSGVGHGGRRLPPLNAAAECQNPRQRAPRA
jgi:hypothetical protein